MQFWLKFLGGINWEFQAIPQTCYKLTSPTWPRSGRTQRGICESHRMHSWRSFHQCWTGLQGDYIVLINNEHQYTESKNLPLIIVILVNYSYLVGILNLRENVYIPELLFRSMFVLSHDDTMAVSPMCIRYEF